MKDAIAEARLTREGVEFEYREALPLTEIDVTGSLRNQARLDPINKAMVEQYALRMIDGEPFPAIIVYNAPNGFRALDGNHRIHAATEAERSAIDAYVVKDPDPLTVVRISRTWNIGNGVPPSRSEVIETAIWFVHNTPYTLRDVARMVGMSDKSLGAYVRGREARDRLDGLNIPTGTLSVGMLTELSRIRDDAVLIEGARLVLRTGLPVDQVSKLVTEVNGKGSEPDRLTVVRSWATKAPVKQRTAVNAGGRFTGVASKRQAIIKLLRSLRAVSAAVGRQPSAVKMGLVLTEDIESVRTSYVEATNRVRRLLDTVVKTAEEVA